LPILVTVALAAAVDDLRLAFIPVGLLTVAWLLRERWSWPRGMRRTTLLIVVVVAAAFLVQQIPDESNDTPTAQQKRLSAEQGVREVAGPGGDVAGPGEIKDVSCVEVRPSGPDYTEYNCEVVYENGRCRKWTAAIGQNEAGSFQRSSRACKSP
jgi:hypothetical protein